MTSLQCSGSEQNILSCSVNNQPARSCAQTEDAGVVCQGRMECYDIDCTYCNNSVVLLESFTNIQLHFATDTSTMQANCSTGNIRLVGTEDVEAGTKEGRVEICINNAWGTVCDKFFGPPDAGVVCHQIGGFTRDGMHVVTAEVLLD